MLTHHAKLRPLFAMVLLLSILMLLSLNEQLHNVKLWRHDSRNSRTPPLLTRRSLLKENDLLKITDEEHVHTYKAKLVNTTKQTSQPVFHHEKREVFLDKSEPRRLVQNFTCTIPSFEGYSYCNTKYKWMTERWSEEPCYAQWGVDGSKCSIITYLSEVERWCPPLVDSTSETKFMRDAKTWPSLKIETDFFNLFKKLKRGKKFKWIMERIELMKTKWITAGKQILSRPYFKSFHQKKVLLHLGLLDAANRWKIAANAFRGGPLGELVQWSDIITSLHVLGHKITLSVTKSDLRMVLQHYLTSITSLNCQIRDKPFDVIYTDIRGLNMLRRHSRSKFHLLKCMLRVVDSFGTEPTYNDYGYAIRKKISSPWGRWNLDPKQFSTMFPHTPDNTFLGFVIDQTDASESEEKMHKKHIAVAYGKDENFWKGKESYLKAVQEYIPIHATVNRVNSSKLPPYVINHNVLPSNKFRSLLRSAKIFVGLGFPYEGPSPLEAVANGAVFLNPVFDADSPMKREADFFFKDKPTSRRLTSQHSYAQTFVGPPYARLVHSENSTEVKEVVKEILSDPQVTGYTPYEFTALGMLERVGFLVEKQEFCFRKKLWPPLSALKVVVANTPSTCVEACRKKGLICERDFFPVINKRTTFETLGVKCDEFATPIGAFEEIDYPSYGHRKCFIQGNHALFSCSGRYTTTQRICPCRDSIKGQVALCKDCYSS